MRLLLIASVFVPVLALADEPSLTPPAGEHVVVEARGKGAQVYVCGDDDKWTLRAPDAQLLDKQDRVIGKHYAGPTWEASDGSKVAGEVVAKVARPGTIPWLLLRGKAQGKGTFASVTSIQRLDTTGGVAPASGCDQAHHGAESRVPYTARYVFFAK